MVHIFNLTIIKYDWFQLLCKLVTNRPMFCSINPIQILKKIYRRSLDKFHLIYYILILLILVLMKILILKILTY